jgi:hypothetical protein
LNTLHRGNAIDSRGPRRKSFFWISIERHQNL